MNLTAILLSCLERVHPSLIREEALLLDVQSWLSAACTLTELRASLRRLEAQGWVVSVRAHAGHALWKITSAGRAALAEIEMGL